jgi:hypothetical protein
MMLKISPGFPIPSARAFKASGLSSLALAFEISLITCPSLSEMYLDFNSVDMGFKIPPMTFFLEIASDRFKLW